MNDNDKQKVYDAYSYRMSVNLYSLNKDRDTINLYGFNEDKPEHMFVFKIALLNSSLFKKRICIETKLSTRIKLSLKYHKVIPFIKKCKNIKEELTVTEILDFMRPFAREDIKDENFLFSDIDI